jgi:hypothetical protein
MTMKTTPCSNPQDATKDADNRLSQLARERL